MATAELESHILSVCSALGGREEYIGADDRLASRYVLGDECIECLRDLKRFLRYDEVNKDKIISKLLGKWQILQKDLLPILSQYNSNHAIATAVVELLVPLTWPFDEYGEPKYDATIIEYLRDYKESFITSEALQNMCHIMMRMLAVPFRQRSDRDNAVIRLVLFLYRNLLAIPDPEASSTATLRIASRAKMQDELVEKMHQVHITEFFLTVASSVNSERQFAAWNTIVVEIVRWLVSGYDPYSIALGYQPKVDKELADMLANEDNQLQQYKRNNISRHSRFGGTLSLKLNDGSKLNLHRQAVRQVERALDLTKKNYQNRYWLKSDDQGQRKRNVQTINSSTLIIVQQFVQSFLESGFNPLMTSVKKDIDMERIHIRDIDIVNYVSVVHFMLEHQRNAYIILSKTSQAQVVNIDRNHKDMEQLNSNNIPTECDKVSFQLLAAVLDVRSMTFLIRSIRNALELKQHAKLYAGIACLKQMLLTLDLMQKSSDINVKQVAQDVQNNLYYDHASLELVVSMLKSFKSQTRAYLLDLIETTHIMMRLLENFVRAKGTIIVKRRARGNRLAANANNENEGITTEVIDAVDYERPDFVEREFDLTTFENTFANEGILATYMASLRDYTTLSSFTIHYIVKMFHRIAVKCKQYPLFFKLTTLDLFARILQSKDTLKESVYHRELYDFIVWITRSFFERFKEYPLLLVEVFFTKKRADSFRITYGRDQDTSKGDLTQSDPNAPHVWDSDDEIEVRQGFSTQSQIMIAASTLVNKNEISLLRWLINELKLVAALRIPSIEMRYEDDETGSMQVFDPYALSMEQPEVQTAMRHNKELQLLCDLLGFGQQKTDEAVVCMVPSTMNAEDLSKHADRLEQCIADPFIYNGKPAYKLLKCKKRRRPREKESEQPRRNKEVRVRSDMFIYDSDAELAGEDDITFYAAERKQKLATARKHKQRMRLEGQHDINSKVKSKARQTKTTPKSTVEQISLFANDSADTQTPNSSSSDNSSSSSDESNGNIDDDREDNADANDDFAQRLLMLRKQRAGKLLWLRSTLSSVTTGSVDSIMGDRAARASKRQANNTDIEQNTSVMIIPHEQLEDVITTPLVEPLGDENNGIQKRRRLVVLSSDDNEDYVEK